MADEDKPTQSPWDKLLFDTVKTIIIAIIGAMALRYGIEIKFPQQQTPAVMVVTTGGGVTPPQVLTSPPTK